VSIKALSGHLDHGAFGWIHPLALVVLAASLVGLAVSARSLQVGEAVSVIAVTSASANLCTIAAGPIVFGEPLPSDQFQLALRLLAFALVIGASALTPPTLGSGGDAPSPATATSSAASG
jgi:multidrug transporter EmrE-like cation transporter